MRPLSASDGSIATHSPPPDAPGIVRMLELLEDEIRRDLGLMGCDSITKIDKSYVCKIPPVKAADVFSAYPSATTSTSRIDRTGAAMAEIKIFNPDALGKPLGQYSQITRVKASEFVLSPGQLAADRTASSSAPTISTRNAFRCSPTSRPR